MSVEDRTGITVECVCVWVCSSEETSPESAVKETFLQNRKRSLPGLPVCSILHSAVALSDEVSRSLPSAASVPGVATATGVPPTDCAL